jgi:hypothetical protein
MYSVLQPNQQGLLIWLEDRARHILVLTDFKSKQHPSSVQLLAQPLLREDTTLKRIANNSEIMCVIWKK